MECPKNDGFLPQTKHTSAISRAVFDRVHHSQNGWHRNRIEVGSVARAMALVSQSPMSEPDSFIALPNHRFHACPAHQYRTSLYQLLSPGLPAHRKLCLVCGPLYSGPPGDLRQSMSFANPVDTIGVLEEFVCGYCNTEHLAVVNPSPPLLPCGP